MDASAPADASYMESHDTAYRVAVVVPLRDDSEFVLRLVQSLIDCGWSNRDRLVLVDDGSDDGTDDLLRIVEGDVDVARSPERIGRAACCNLGARAVDARWIVLLDPRCTPSPGWLERLLAHARATDSGIVGPRTTGIDGRAVDGPLTIANGQPPASPLRGRAATDPAVRAALDCQVLADGCVLVDAALFAELDGLDERDDAVAVADLCLRARAAGARVHYQGEVGIERLPRPRTTGAPRGDELPDWFADRWTGLLYCDRVEADGTIAVADRTAPWNSNRAARRSAA